MKQYAIPEYIQYTVESKGVFVFNLIKEEGYLLTVEDGIVFDLLKRHNYTKINEAVGYILSLSIAQAEVVVRSSIETFLEKGIIVTS